MPCPFFFPTEACDQSLWPFPARLPLGAGYAGRCMAPGIWDERGEGALPSEADLQRFCNLGYSEGCSRLPHERTVDANRFFVSQKADELIVTFCSERQHLPVEHAVLRFDSRTQSWTSGHQNACVQRQAECAVESFMRRREGEKQNSTGRMGVGEDGPSSVVGGRSSAKAVSNATERTGTLDPSQSPLPRTLPAEVQNA